MFRKVLSSALLGLEAVPVYVEADVSDGLPMFAMVGSLGTQVKEAQDRVRTALKNVGFSLPPKRITINLSPADIHKDGSRFDLAIALAILMSQGLLPQAALEGVMVVGELSLGGAVNGVTGVLGTVMAAARLGCCACLIPRANLQEGSLIDGIRIIGVANLEEAIRYVRDGLRTDGRLPRKYPRLNDYKEDFADICGQHMVKRAALIAAAGFHNILMSGPPGSGKTMVARRMSSILPPLTKEESLEITQIYSVAGLLKNEDGIMTTRPFRAPHHTVTSKALSGGGLMPKPGEITLAHRGILFLDEMPEFARGTLEILRQPLENHEITIARTTGNYRFPANFLLVASMNPCPCGGYGIKGSTCSCTQSAIERYQERISKPLLDRIDLKVVVPQISYGDLTSGKKSGLSSSELRKEAEKAHAIQHRRFKEAHFMFNAEIPSALLKTYCPMTEEAEKRAETIFREKKLSARGYHRMIRVARTSADLDGSEIIDRCHIDEADMFRMALRKPEM